MVNEILPSGEVLHLRSTTVPPALGGKNKDKKKDEQAPTATQTSAEPAAQPEPEPAKQEEQQEKEKPATTEIQQISDEDRELLESYFGAEASEKIQKLHKRSMTNSKARPSEFGKVTTDAINDRDLRTKMHQAIRRIFNSQLESSTDGDGAMSVMAAPNRFKRDITAGRGGNPRQGGGRINWDELGGQFLHFTIYKENKDTMETISFIARQLKMNPKTFQFAGTKDRRGVTVQRACAYRVLVDRLAKVNKTLRSAAIGDFEYRPHGLDLGDLNGNEFVVTLRDCEIPGIDMTNTTDEKKLITTTREIVGQSLHNLRERGYFNYYGLQRFGTFSMRTDTIGRRMLQGDFQGACDTILHVSPHVLAAALGNPEDPTVLISSEDKARAEAIHRFRNGAKPHAALEKLPRKFSAEANLIRHLSKSKSDYLGALQTIPRNLRLIYVHAYQSLVWNFAVGERWRLYGDRVVEGDLVIVNEHKDKEINTNSSSNQQQEQHQHQHQQPIETDPDGEIIIHPNPTDTSTPRDDIFTRARPLSATEASSGNYQISDIVLPLPGFDILYPPNAMTGFYKRFMGDAEGGGLDPFDMRRRWKDISLSGSYRKVVQRVGGVFEFDVRLYGGDGDDEEQFVRTDVEVLGGGDGNGNGNGKDGDGEKPESSTEYAAGAGPVDDSEKKKKKLAIILKFQLGTSQYATMALRELTKGKGKGYVPDYGGR